MRDFACRKMQVSDPDLGIGDLFLLYKKLLRFFTFVPSIKDIYFSLETIRLKANHASHMSFHCQNLKNVV